MRADEIYIQAFDTPHWVLSLFLSDIINISSNHTNITVAEFMKKQIYKRKLEKKLQHLMKIKTLT